jgi:predicted nucleic acid-binding protein
MAADGRFFVDTWGWLVLSNARDPAFAGITALRRGAGDRQSAWVTTDYVLDETITRLFMTAPFALANRFIEGIFEASRLGTLDIEHVTPERFTQAWKLRLRYRDKLKFSFTDLTSFTVMRELGLCRVITGDSHFEQAGLGFSLAP